MSLQPRRNRVDPFGDLHSTPERGVFTGNRGCLVDDRGVTARHHRGSLWIACELEYKDWRSPLDQPGRWTPLFFLDEATALAAGHRPCGLCRRPAYESYRDAVGRSLGLPAGPSAGEINEMLSRERLSPGRGVNRKGDRVIWRADLTSLPRGTVIVTDDREPLLVGEATLLRFGFSGWSLAGPRGEGPVDVLTPPTSVAAMQHGFTPVIHDSAATWM